MRTLLSSLGNLTRLFRFYRVGGSTRISGFLLAVANAVLLLVGTGPIAYIRKSLSLLHIPLLLTMASQRL